MWHRRRGTDAALVEGSLMTLRASVRRLGLAALGLVAFATACSDAKLPSSPIAAVSAQASVEDLPISGPTLVGMGQLNTWTVSIGASWWEVNGTNAGSGPSFQYSSETSFALDAWTWVPCGFGCAPTIYHGSLDVQVWQGCDPREQDKTHPMYCNAHILSEPTAAANGQQCTWGIDTNMPSNTVVKWYVNDQLKWEGFEFTYTVAEQSDFYLYMTAEHPNFGGRNEHRTISVGNQYSCWL